jgi:hypothetical protein
MKTDKLESRIEVRFTESEKKKVFQRAKKDKLTVSEWIRRRCLSDYTETVTQVYIPIDMPPPMPTTPLNQLLHDGEPCL